MNLYRVGCWRPTDEEDDEPRVAVVAAASEEEAVGVCRNRADSDAYARFEVLDVVEPKSGAEAVPSGPARVVGFEGDRAWTWK
jgi:hypothetical protein